MERDHERLKQMTYYCFTHECLREYILRYFGEYGSSYCGNCANCLTEFEEKDVTEEAKAILECVNSSHQRYGVTVILDTLCGASTAKIRQYHMNENPCYGKCASTPIYRLRQIFNYLLMKDYLSLTNDEYTIVKLTVNSAAVINGETELTMKLAKAQPKKVSEKKEKKVRPSRLGSAAGVMQDEDEPLFQRLRNLRMEIAREEKVPPYIVFSDRTLVHMCILKPKNKEEMMMVNGVGEHKYTKYGEKFLKEIFDYQQLSVN